jgi:tripartite-type tricarboxylate transporter receptor subunit TctC
LHLMFPTAPVVLPYLKTGKLKGLAVTSASPSALVPGLITVSASGLPGYESGSILAIFAPARTPEPIIQRLNQEIVRVLNNAEQKEKFLGLGLETVGNSPEQLGAVIKSEMVKWGKVIRDAGIKAE